MTNLLRSLFGAVLLLTGITSYAGAANVTPGVIFGSGNANGDFTVDRQNGIEIGLRAKQRYPAANVFNYDGVDTYTFEAGRAADTPSGAGQNPSRPLWNFEWSINTDFDGTSGRKLNDVNYLLLASFTPTGGINQGTFAFDPINTAYADHALGTNLTTSATKIIAGSGSEYATLISQNNVAQNSWSMHWFDALFDPTATGIYTLRLLANDVNGILADTSINIAVTAVPLPAALPLYAAGVAILGFFGWRRRQKTT
ncbi:hypothetical protein GUA87_05150 [Sneathiella sp. P13V-1]|uniref:hypothetical protein n=1 Tax=Sneathiella sp. P13V-1 TaxID=2697366 RepID=UPI00187B39D4|nr:hypothetical protein [Sneathiella sp. P13V-1]MBE7636220.1 hypothetical protein [Sneathiella sp. P13V-1]